MTWGQTTLVLKPLGPMSWGQTILVLTSWGQMILALKPLVPERWTDTTVLTPWVPMTWEPGRSGVQRVTSLSVPVSFDGLKAPKSLVSWHVVPMRTTVTAAGMSAYSWSVASSHAPSGSHAVVWPATDRCGKKKRYLKWTASLQQTVLPGSSWRLKRRFRW